MSRRHRTISAAAGSSVGVRDRLVATASELFNREGVRAVGIQRIIDEAGVAKASLYAHFGSKDDLVAACLDTWISARQAHTEKHLRDSAHDARGKLLALFDLQVEWIRNPTFRGCPLQSVSAEIADPEHPAKRVIARHRQWLCDLITTLVATADLQPVGEVVGALIVIYDGAFSAALVDGNAAMAQQSRWAAERLIDASRPPRSATSTSRGLQHHAEGPAGESALRTLVCLNRLADLEPQKDLALFDRRRVTGLTTPGGLSGYVRGVTCASPRRTRE